MTEVTIYSRRECHLCDVVLRIVQQVQTGHPFTLTQVKIDDDPLLLEQYGTRVPVVAINGREMFAGKVTEGDFRRAIVKARERRPISRILSRLRQWLRRG